MPHHARETVESIIYARRVRTVALVLALAAAVLHATWNLLLAGSEDTEAATAVALVAGLVVGAPVAILSWHVHAPRSPTSSPRRRCSSRTSPCSPAPIAGPT